MPTNLFVVVVLFYPLYLFLSVHLPPEPPPPHPPPHPRPRLMLSFVSLSTGSDMLVVILYNIYIIHCPKQNFAIVIFRSLPGPGGLSATTKARFLADNKSLACRLNAFKYIMCVYNSCFLVVVFVNAVCDICSLNYCNILKSWMIYIYIYHP